MPKLSRGGKKPSKYRPKVRRSSFSDDETEYSKSFESEIECVVNDLLFIGKAADNRPGKKYRKRKKKKVRRKKQLKKCSDDESRSSIGYECFTTRMRCPMMNCDKSDESDSIEEVSNHKKTGRRTQRSYDSSTDTSSQPMIPTPIYDVRLQPKKHGRKTQTDYGSFEPDYYVYSAKEKKRERKTTRSKGTRKVERKKGDEDSIYCPHRMYCGKVDDRIKMGCNVFQNFNLSDNFLNRSASSLMGRAANSLFPTKSFDMSKDEESVQIQVKKDESEILPDVIEETEDEKDQSLIDISINAARFKHDKLGILFEESSLDFSNDIKFIPVTITLPLGLTFTEECYNSCHISEIFPSGNAAALTGDTVEVGDFLIAVNEKCVYKKPLEKIYSIIAEFSNQKDVQFTFLRYTKKTPNFDSHISEEIDEINANFSEEDVIIPVKPDDHQEDIIVQKEETHSCSVTDISTSIDDSSEDFVEDAKDNVEVELDDPEHGIPNEVEEITDAIETMQPSDNCVGALKETHCVDNLLNKEIKVVPKKSKKKKLLSWFRKTF